MPTIKFSDNPNEETAFVTQDGGQRNRAVLTAALSGTIKYPDNPNSTKVIVTVDGVEHKAVAVADIAGGGGGGGGSSLPDQTGNTGKFLTTDGTDASWSDKPLVNTATGNNALTILGTASSGSAATNVGTGSSATSTGATAFGRTAKATSAGAIAIGMSSEANNSGSIAIGRNTVVTAASAIMIAANNSASKFFTNSDANTFKVANANGNFEIMSADGTIPEARLADTTSAQQGDVLTLDSTGNAVWQAGSGGGLPTQTGNAGKFLTTDGTDASWSDKPLVNNSTNVGALAVGSSSDAARQSVAIGVGATVSPAYLSYSTAIGRLSKVSANNAIAVGANAETTGSNAIAIGDAAKASGQGSIQLGYGQTNSDANTFKVANANGNFELMNANGNLPADRLASTTGLADGNYRLRLVMASGVPTLEWVAE